MEAWLRDLFAWLPEGGIYYFLLGLVAYLESIVAVGLLIPGSVLCVFAGFLAFHGKGGILALMAACGTGALFGDLTSYLIGGRLGEVLRERPFLRKRRQLLHRADLFFADHGGKGVFLGRFVGPIRGLVPFAAGGARMRPLPFTAWTLASATLWGLAYPGLGYLGGASWQRVQELSRQFALLVAVLGGLMVLDLLFWRYLAPRLARRGGQFGLRLQERLERLRESPSARAFAAGHPRLWGFLSARFSLRRGSGLHLSLGFLACSLFGALFLVVAELSRLQEPLRRLDLWVYEAVTTLHHPLADRFFLVVTTLGGLPVILLLGLWALLALLLANRDFSAFILGIGTAGGTALVFLLKEIYERPRPEAFLNVPAPVSSAFPSAHACLALVFYGLLTYLALDRLAQWERRMHLLLAGTGLALLIGFSRIYLGVHWFSDVLAGLALAGLWLSFLITASEVRRRFGGEHPWRRGWRPVRLSRPVRIGILAAAGLAVLTAVGTILWGRVQLLG